MEGETPIFKKIYHDYLRDISGLDLRAVAKKVGARGSEGIITLPLFGKHYQVSIRGVFGPSGREPSHSIRVVLFQYLLLHPSSDPEDNTWVSFKDFRDAAPFVDAFHNNAERGIARNFTGRVETLKAACRQLGGYSPHIQWAYDLQMKFDALPRVPLLLLFNDADDEFPAQCRLLFEHRAKEYLDMECLAILGWLLAGYLNELSGNASPEKV